MVKKKKDNEPPDKDVLLKSKTPYRTIKTTLKSIIKEEYIGDINEIVLRCNQIVIDCYQFINLYVLKIYNDILHKKKSIDDLPILDDKFIRYCFIVLTIGKSGRKPINIELIDNLNEFYIDEFQPINNHQKISSLYLSPIIVYLTTYVETNIKNNLKEHYIQRLTKYLNNIADYEYDLLYDNEIDKYSKEYIIEKKKQLHKLKNAIVFNEFDNIPDIFINWFNLKKKSFMPDEFTKSLAYDCQKSPHKYLYYTLSMNHQLERFNDRIKNEIIYLHSILNGREKYNFHSVLDGNLITNISKDEINIRIKNLNKKVIKLYHSIPMRNNCIPNYINIDTVALIKIFAGKGFKTILCTNVVDNQDMIWKWLFKTDKKIFKDSGEYTFNYSLQTDGIGCSILFKHNSIKDKKFGQRIDSVFNTIPYIDDLNNIQTENLKTKKIITADPGKKFLLYMRDENGNELKYSQKQRQTERLSKRNTTIRNTNKKRKFKIDGIKTSIEELETELSFYTSKSVKYYKMKEFIHLKNIINQETNSFYKAELHRKMKFREYVYTQKSEAKLMNNIEKKFGCADDIVIVIGDWSNKGKIRGLASTMGVGLKNLINKKFTTLLVDEYNTSKKCCNCHQDIDNVIINNNKLHRLLECKNESCYRESHKSNNSTGNQKDLKSVLKCKYMTRDRNSCINMMTVVKHMIETNGGKLPAFSRRYVVENSNISYNIVLNHINNVI